MGGTSQTRRDGVIIVAPIAEGDQVRGGGPDSIAIVDRGRVAVSGPRDLRADYQRIHWCRRRRPRRHSGTPASGGFEKPPRAEVIVSGRADE